MKVFTPRRSQRKFSQASVVPITNPAPHRVSPTSATITPELKPRTRVSHAMRRSVARPRGTSISLGAIFASRKPPQDVPYSRKESDPAQQEGEDHFGMQPAIEEIPHHSTQNDSRYKNEGELHGQTELVGEVLRFVCCGFLRAGLIGFIVRRHIGRAA